MYIIPVACSHQESTHGLCSKGFSGFLLVFMCILSGCGLGVLLLIVLRLVELLKRSIWKTVKVMISWSSPLLIQPLVSLDQELLHIC